MDFRIQASCPNCYNKFDEEITNLSDAIENTFPMWTETAIIMWKSIPVPLSYKYDISMMIDDILEMLCNIRTNPSGNMEIHWASNTFANKWDLSWDDDNIHLKSVWGCVVGGTEQLLTLSGNIRISKLEFTREWKQLLCNVIVALSKAGYTEGKFRSMSRLVTEYDAIDGNGVLYQHIHS